MAKLENKTLDEIGKHLVKASAFSTREIEKITANPALFDSILARAKSTPTEVATTTPRYFGRALAGTFAGLAITVAAAFAFMIYNAIPVEVVVDQPHEAPKVAKPKVFSQPDHLVNTGFVRSNDPVRIERISAKPEPKSIRIKRTEAQQIRHEEDFYALSYAGDPNETERGGRIVRVDVPRSTLFAMGIDVPLENETETIKADLLIGSDGVTRGIRVVK